MAISVAYFEDGGMSIERDGSEVLRLGPREGDQLFEALTAGFDVRVRGEVSDLLEAAAN